MIFENIKMQTWTARLKVADASETIFLKLKSIWPIWFMIVDYSVFTVYVHFEMRSLTGNTLSDSAAQITVLWM